MFSAEFKLIILFWQIGLIDTFSLLKLCANAGSQYVGVVVASSAGNFSGISPSVLFEPVLGFGTSYQFVMAAKTLAEKRQRIATLAAFLSTSVTALTTDPATNGAVGGAVAAKICYMKAILANGGGTGGLALRQFKSSSIITDSSVRTFSVNNLSWGIHPYREVFTSNSKIAITNMVAEHTGRRYLTAAAQKIKTVGPASIATVTSSQLNITAAVCWTSLGLGVITFSTLGALYLFQRAEERRWINVNEEVVIDAKFRID